ncbi:MAG: DNA helicase, partial [Lachnospiraceae bacterium]|nr:DNA helicase [Lachnospiraceae bacterium]
MNTVCRDIFRAIHEGKWLSIEYRNQKGETTKYWIGIRDLDIAGRTLFVDGLHLRQYTVKALGKIRIDAILSSAVVEGSWCPVNRELVLDIYENPHKYASLFDNAVNLKVLNYLEMCSRMDTTPYLKDFALVRYLDRERIRSASCPLSREQFQTIVRHFQYQTQDRKKSEGGLKIRQLAMNVLSIHTPEGLYVLAYRRLNLDIKNCGLKPEEDITVCTEFTLDGTVQSVRRFLDAEEYELLQDFEDNQEAIKDRIAEHLPRRGSSVDDMPYIIGLGMDIPLDLHKEYESIIRLCQSGEATEPIRAFFGSLLERPRRTGAYPIALINHNINMDQLLAIHNAMKYPVAYIQGPPGTGKTNTIINTIVTAFFNERTVLVTAYNNHPINSVYDKFSGMEYRGKKIPFPILRIGTREKMKEALRPMAAVYEAC